MAHNLNPIYGQSFVGIWKRMSVSGRPEHNLSFLIFNADASFQGPIGPGSRKIMDQIDLVNADPAYPQKGEIVFNFRGKELKWSYTLNRNNAFKSEFRPIHPSSKTPPVLNELLLVGQGTRQLYAFFSYPFQRICLEHDILEHAR